MDTSDFRAASLKACDRRAFKSWAYAVGVPVVAVVTAGLQFNMTTRGKFSSLPCTRKNREKPEFEWTLEL